MHEKECLVFLNLLSIGYRTVLKLRETFGTLKDALSAPESDLLNIKGIRRKTLEAMCEKRSSSCAEKELALLERTSFHAITIDEPEYPEYLRQISTPPLVLYVWGTLTPADSNAIAVVGTRNPTQYGKRIAHKISYDLAGQDVTIVSGLAKGLDSEAHRGALESGGRTIAVLGSGLLRLYPHENKRLAEKIAHNGAVIAEFPLETTPFRSNFPIRNRIISGLSMGTIVVEAAVKSGTLITAGFALEQNRTVFGIPGNIDQPSSEGVNALIKQGASLIQSVDDIFRELPTLKRSQTLSETKASAQPKVKLSPEEKEIFDLISTQPIHIDEITEKSSRTAPEVSVLVLTLEIKQVIKQIPGKFYTINENVLAAARG